MISSNFENDKIIVLSMNGNWEIQKFNTKVYSYYVSGCDAINMTFYSPEIFLQFSKYLDEELQITYNLPNGWYESRSPKGRLYFLDTLNKVSTWSHPSMKFNIPIGWERIDSQSEGIYYHHLFLNHSQRYNPNLWISAKSQTVAQNQHIFLNTLKKYQYKNVEMNLLFYAYLIFKKENAFKQSESLLYKDLSNIYDALHVIFYLKVKDLFTKYEKIRAEIVLRMYMKKLNKSSCD